MNEDQLTDPQKETCEQTNAQRAYYGTKRIEAWPEEKDDQPGYGVQYEDGYVSWSPKDVFEKAYQPISAMSFGHAIQAMKEGHRVQRANWNGPGQFIELQNPDENSKMNLPYIFISTVHGQLVPWLASQTDMLANDWRIIT